MPFVDEVPPQKCLADAALCASTASASDKDLIGNFERR
jgi:hypothetical protein